MLTYSESWHHKRFGFKKQGIATIKDKVADCKKDRKGRFKVKLTVEGKTGKATKIKVYGRRQRKSETGKCLVELLKKAQFPRFKRKRQTFKWRFRIK